MSDFFVKVPEDKSDFFIQLMEQLGYDYEYLSSGMNLESDQEDSYYTDSEDE